MAHQLLPKGGGAETAALRECAAMDPAGVDDNKILMDYMRVLAVAAVGMVELHHEPECDQRNSAKTPIMPLLQ